MSVSMQAGKLRHVVRVEKRAPGKDSLGQKSGKWLAVVPSSRARITTLVGRELEIARQLVPKATTEIEMRYDSRIDEQCMIVSAGRTYDIGFVNDVDQRHAKLLLTCAETKTSA